ncbi:hypothetical protein TWF730_000608 [Orbilia blumenaviensis]|uniref:C2H2-type domain-containing protein n=1 Tax=Orbilia blumenaviensis TaxID=1796055 RepID=A0AAV9VM93_9PEZI
MGLHGAYGAASSRSSDDDEFPPWPDTEATEVAETTDAADTTDVDDEAADTAETKDFSEYSRTQREYYLKYQGERWDRCHRCNLVFSTVEEAAAHFEETCPCLWCKRCEVTFKTPEEREEHFIHGSAHWRCGVCKYDAPAVDVQEYHWRKTNHKFECRGCNFWYEKKYWDKHLTTSHACTRCHKHHGDEGKRKQHEAEHAKEAGTFLCVGRCGREFPTIGGMYGHIETGHCDSSIDSSDVLRCFAIHPGAEYLLVKDRKAILQRIFEGKHVYVNPFKCPGEGCEEGSFKTFSAFLQHATSKRCPFEFKSGPESMLVHMGKHLFVDSAIARIQAMNDNTRSGLQIHPLIPEHPRDRTPHTIIPNPDILRPFFTNIARCFQVCMKELILRPSRDIKKQGTIRIRIMKSFNREVGHLEKIFYKGNQMYADHVTNARNPHGDLLIYFQAMRMGVPAWRFLRDMHKVIRLFRVMLDFEAPHQYRHH